MHFSQTTVNAMIMAVTVTYEADFHWLKMFFFKEVFEFYVNKAQ